MLTCATGIEVVCIDFFFLRLSNVPVLLLPFPITVAIELLAFPYVTSFFDDVEEGRVCMKTECELPRPPPPRESVASSMIGCRG